MCVRVLIWLVAAAVACVCVCVHGRVRVVNGGYEGVVVGVSQSIGENTGGVAVVAIVNAIKSTISELSRRLFRATERRIYIKSATILVPRSWRNVTLTHTPGSESFENSDIRVDEMNPIYQHQPYTLQTGGCGVGGHFIHLTSTYLMDDTEASWWGPRGKVLLMEWAKYRWGIFDEIGYASDPSFPLFYNSGGRFSPTHCADKPLIGRRIDKMGRGGCVVDGSGRPNKDCRFVPYEDQEVESSLMSYPLIKSDKITHFCGQAGFPHNVDAPTKQNLYCNKRSVWDVITAHEDFADTYAESAVFQETEFRVVQQADATFALVLDYSGSMNDHYRVHKLRRTARRWLLYEVAEGSRVAIINFNKKAILLTKMTRIDGENSRKFLADSIVTRADGGTSIGAGLYVAAKTVLHKMPNPVILLITDGEENENPRINDVMSDVMLSGARVVTVAFGAEADPELERVAEMSGGKTFTVNDVDEGQMLEDAFQGALTYQPPPPLDLQTITIHEMEYKDGGREASGSFNVDFTVGRNMTLRLETGTQAHRSSPSLTSPQVTSAPVLISPSGQVYKNARFESDTSTWSILVPMAEEGEWMWKVGLSGERRSFVRSKVTSLPRDPAVQPITTRAWVSQGAREVNASVDRVIVFAEVKQGNSPVVNAEVRALVTPPAESDPPKVYHLLDNGQGADMVQGDGIYSRYITTYPSTGRYSVKAQVTDGGGNALINNGFLTLPHKRERREMREENEDKKYLEYYLGQKERCCGSVVPISPQSPPTGRFQRIQSGGSFKVTNIPTKDIFAPSKVMDLSVKLIRKGWTRNSLPMHVFVSFSWTATGDDLDNGFVSGYQLRMTSNETFLREENFLVKTHTHTQSSSFSSSSSSSSSSSTWRLVDLSGHKWRVEGGTKVHLNLSLTLTSKSTFFALKAWDDEGIVSEVSNIAPLLLDLPPGTYNHAEGGVRVWIVVVIAVVSFCLVVMIVLLCVARRRKRRSAIQKMY